MTEDKQPRKPSVEEKKALASYCAKKMGISEKVETATVEKAYIAVFDRYRQAGPGYTGKVMAVVWEDGPPDYEVFYWPQGTLAPWPQHLNPGGWHFIDDLEHEDAHSSALVRRELRHKLPPLYSQADRDIEAIAQVKFWLPDGNWRWYATEFNGKDMFCGLIDNGVDAEVGYFSLSQLKTVRGPLGLGVERDRRFEPTSLRELIQRCK